MRTLRHIKPFIILFAVCILIAACSSEDATLEIGEDAVSTSVAGTQAAAAAATDAAEEAVEAFDGDLQPLEASECQALADAMAGALAVSVEQANVAVDFEGRSGGGCQVAAVGTGVDFADMPSVEAAMRGLLEVRGWGEIQSAEACLGIGGWGPGANVICFTSANKTCGVFVHIDPSDPALCSDDEPIGVCFSELAPDQLVYSIDLTCAEDTTMTTDAEDEIVDPDPIDLLFAPGEDNTRVPGNVPAGGIDRYLLTAMEGQEMTVNLLDPGGAQIAYDTAVLVIWGADGTVLISDHADALTWAGELPSTQEYTIDVKSIGSEPTAYILEIIIPPPEGAGDVFPKEEPFLFGEMQTIVFSGVPPMLPPEFPIGEDQPLLLADVITWAEGLYEVEVYFSNCRRDGPSGACHYGTAYGKKAASTIPVGTSTFQFDIADAQPVELAYGITGYFTLGECGASCDDSRVRWVYGGYEYMLGLKGGQLDDVVALANAAILNSIP